MTEPDRRLVSSFSDRLPFLYQEKCAIIRENGAVVAVTEKGKTQIPAATIACLALGPGTSITQSALMALGECGCPVAWMGSNGIRFYSFSQPLSSSTNLLERQAELWANPESRLRIAHHLYARRFGPLNQVKSIDQIRGEEGLRTAVLYQQAAQNANLPWQGRQTDRPWDEQDAPNRAISVAMSCLYAVVGAACLSQGLALGLGFLHEGTPEALVYDIADLYRFDDIVPMALAWVREEDQQLESTIRDVCGSAFSVGQIGGRVIRDLREVLAA